MTDDLKERILQILDKQGSGRISLNELLKALQLPLTDRRHLRRLLRELGSEGKLVRVRGHSYAQPAQLSSCAGILRVSSKGFGFVVPEQEYVEGGGQREIYVPRKRMGDALDSDRVLVQIVDRSGKNPEGQIIEVLERGTREIVGTFYHTRLGGNVIPRDERFARSISTPRPDPSLELIDGSYVVVEITSWTPATQPLIGRVKERLGDPGTPGIDITMIIRDSGASVSFPGEVLAQTEEIPSQIPGAEIARRADLRHLVTFTMDGITAKDFDDALSIERLDGRGWRLGVHIADVAHYVREDSHLDLEARDRATSIYPVDRVIPMLPEKLSNDLCSLRPNEDRLTLTCFMEIDLSGQVHGYSIRESVIRSSFRLVYEDVQALVEGKADPALIRSIGAVRAELAELYELRRALTRMRIERGALDLDIPETEVIFADDGSVANLIRRERLESHRVVEECMLIANEVVAAHLFDLHLPSVYRVHEPPDMNKLYQLQPILAHLGIRFPARKAITADAIQIALDRASQMEIGFIARRLILRAMMRAHYSDENLGHYGLASSCYTHFTSPIRRYPDLLVHRILKESMAAGAPCEGAYMPPGQVPSEHGLSGKPHVSLLKPPPLAVRRVGYLRSRLGGWTLHCSERERRAESIENDAAAIKGLEFIHRFLGEDFEGYITSVTNWGFYVELKAFPIEGLVHVRTLHGDFFEYDEDRMILVGKQSGATFKLGDRVTVRIENVNILALELDLGLVEKHVSEGSTEKIAEGHRRRLERETRRHIRRPAHRGFQARGRRRR